MPGGAQEGRSVTVGVSRSRRRRRGSTGVWGTVFRRLYGAGSPTPNPEATDHMFGVKHRTGDGTSVFGQQPPACAHAKTRTCGGAHTRAAGQWRNSARGPPLVRRGV